MNDFNYPLSVLQQWMQAMITFQSIPDADGELAAMRVPDVVNSSQRLNAGMHFEIYRTSYIARLRECMRNIFGALAYALGNELFEAFADEYLAAHPSHSYTLNNLGAEFAAFLVRTRPDADETQKELWPDFMIELVRFEYAVSLIFDEHCPIDGDAAKEDTPDEELKLTPVFHLFHYQYPICRYYLDYSRKEAPELPSPEESWCVVVRVNYRLGLFVVKPAQYYFLLKMKNGASIDDAKKAVINNFHFTPDALALLWAEWRRFFIVSGFFVIR